MKKLLGMIFFSIVLVGFVIYVAIGPPSNLDLSQVDDIDLPVHLCIAQNALRDENGYIPKEEYILIEKGCRIYYMELMKK